MVAFLFLGFSFYFVFIPGGSLENIWLEFFSNKAISRAKPVYLTIFILETFYVVYSCCCVIFSEWNQFLELLCQKIWRGVLWGKSESWWSCNAHAIKKSVHCTVNNTFHKRIWKLINQVDDLSRQLSQNEFYKITKI